MTAHTVWIHLIGNLSRLIRCFSSFFFFFLFEFRNSSFNCFCVIVDVSNRLSSSRTSMQLQARGANAPCLGRNRFHPSIIEAFNRSQGNLNVSSQLILTLPAPRSPGTASPRSPHISPGGPGCGADQAGSVPCQDVSEQFHCSGRSSCSSVCRKHSYLNLQ